MAIEYSLRHDAALWSDAYLERLVFAYSHDEVQSYVRWSLATSLLDIGFSSDFIADILKLLNAIVDKHRLGHFRKLSKKFLLKWSAHLDIIYGIKFEKFRASYFLDCVFDFFQTDRTKSVLDLGCGRGYISRLILDTFEVASVIGIDDVSFDKDWRHLEREKALSFQVVHIDEQAAWLAKQPAYSTILIAWVFHHSAPSDVRKALLSIRSAQPDAQLIILEDSVDLGVLPQRDPFDLHPEWVRLHEQEVTHTNTAPFRNNAQCAHAVLDFVAVQLLARYHQVNMPQNYQPASVWRALLAECGYSRIQSRYIGFPTGRDIAVPQLVIEARV